MTAPVVALAMDPAGTVAELRRSHLHQLIADPETTGGYAVVAGQARRLIIDQPFVAGVASGAVKPTVTVTIPAASQGEVGLLLRVDVQLSAQRLANLTITGDGGEQILVEQPAVAGRKKPWGLWLPFRAGASITIANPSSSFYVWGQVYAPVVYLQQTVFNAIREELVADFGELLRCHA